MGAEHIAAKTARPTARGLFDPAHEHDACGVGFIAQHEGRDSHAIVENGLKILENLSIAAPWAPIRSPATAPASSCRSRTASSPRRRRLGFALPEPGDYGVGHLFMPRDPAGRDRLMKLVAGRASRRARRLLGWRDVPADNSCLSEGVESATEPAHRQVFIARGADTPDEEAFERKLFIIRKVISNRSSARSATRPTTATIRLDVGPDRRLQGHVPRLPARRLLSATCTTSASKSPSRSSTSASRPTPSRPGSWPIPTGWSPTTARSTPFAATSTGWRRARPASPRTLLGDDISKLWPISYEGQSDTACFDNALEFLVRGGYSLPTRR